MPFQWTNQGGGWIDVASRLQDLSDAKQMAVLRDQAAIRQRLSDEQARRVADLKLKGDQYALRGQLLGTVETPEDYSRVMPILQSEGLPTQDLPEQRKSEAWLTFAKKPEMTAAPAWLADKWRPAGGPSLPTPTDLPSESMQSPGIAPEEIATSVRRAAERGLSLDKQQRFQDQDIGRQIQLANLARVQDKDALSREWMAFQREAKIQGMSEAEIQREFQRRMALMGFGLDVQKLELQKKQEARTAATTPKFTSDQTNAATYGRRVEAGLSDLDRISSTGYDPTSPVNAGTIYALVTGAPGAKLVAGPEARQTAQSYRNIVNAILRRESGAAIAASEFDNAQQQYFPALGDDPGTLAQKRRNLEQAMAGLKTGAGAAWDATPQITAPGKPATAPSAPARSARNQQEFNAIWSTLKPGETLVGPDGRTWKKGGGR